MKFKANSKGGILLPALFLTAFLAFTSTDIFAQEKEDKPNPKLAKQAKISMEKAKEIALGKATGAVEDAELEKEHGKLVYSFDIRNEKGTITEVQVDAKTGKIVSVEEEDKAAEEKEKQEELREKAKKHKKT